MEKVELTKTEISLLFQLCKEATETDVRGKKNYEKIMLKLSQAYCTLDNQ